MKRAFTFVEFIVVVAIIGILAVILLPVFVRTHCYEGIRPRCQSNLRQISLGFMQYVQDYNGKLPPTSIGHGQGWANSTQPYIRSWQVFFCPSSKREVAKTSDYFYNGRLAKLSYDSVKKPAQTLMLGEGVFDSMPDVSLSTLPTSWRKSYPSPSKRHLDGANYAFADGHVKYLVPQKVTLESPKKPGVFTFLPQ